MVTYKQAVEINSNFRPSYDTPVAVFVGGTSGVGESMAKAFARSTNGNAHIIIIGRNRTSAEATISSFPRHAKSKYEFIQVKDFSLMKEVDTIAHTLLSALSRINFLVLSTGYLTLAGRQDTPEGNDAYMSVSYYSRWKFVHDLLPLLHKAADAGEDAKAMSVLGAGQGSEVDLDNLGLVRDYSLFAATNAVGTYTDMAYTKFAEENPKIAFVHAFPGVVQSATVGRLRQSASRWYHHILVAVVSLSYYLIGMDQKTCAEYQLSTLLTAKPGFETRGKNGEEVKRIVMTEQDREKLYKHTLECTVDKVE